MFPRQKLTFQEPLRSTLAAKWGEEMMDEGFVPFPKRLLRCLAVVFPKSERIRELQVMLAVADYLRMHLTRGPSVDYLAFLTGITQKEVKEALKGLRAKRLIEVSGPEEHMEISNKGLRKKVHELTKVSEEDEPDA